MHAFGHNAPNRLWETAWLSAGLVLLEGSSKSLHFGSESKCAKEHTMLLLYVCEVKRMKKKIRSLSLNKDKHCPFFPCF